MRRRDWAERLADYIESRRETPFVYGAHDCCQFVAGAVAAITYANPAAAWSYSSEAEAEALLAAHGGVAGLVTLALGAEPVHPSQARRGDVVLAELEHGPTAGVCLGTDCAFATEVGVTFRPRALVTAAWRVD